MRDGCNRSPLTISLFFFFLKIKTSQFSVIHIKPKSVFKILQQETEQLFFLLRYET